MRIYTNCYLRKTLSLRGVEHATFIFIAICNVQMCKISSVFYALNRIQLLQIHLYKSPASRQRQTLGLIGIEGFFLTSMLIESIILSKHQDSQTPLQTLEFLGQCLFYVCGVCPKRWCLAKSKLTDIIAAKNFIVNGGKIDAIKAKYQLTSAQEAELKTL